VKLIGLDVGDRRVGTAFGDTSLRLATPMTVVERSSIEDDARAIANLAREFDAELVIVGLPRNMDGSIGPQAAATLAFVDAIAPSVPVPMQMWDERLSTVEAAQRRPPSGSSNAPARGARRKKVRPNLDAHAAAVILQDYMDDQANRTHENNT
jgi:putative holliday junction resolvase